MNARLIVELDQDAPPAGRVLREDGSIVEFHGWTGLAAAIGSTTQERSAPEDEAAGGCRTTVRRDG